MSFINQLRLQPNALCISPGNLHWDIFQNLIETTKAKGNLIPDAYHAALAIESGSEWVTTDKGFNRVVNATSVPITLLLLNIILIKYYVFVAISS